ncbi:hypothetical protein LPJ73_002914 [Coemansia sp. RSA 2703]|nr:hypothetical protein LPJ73_002914 [Coemansia sp. RSA 2703]KAJ2364825.1 hypothetical protein IW150_006382 [Coemansia sp. RSA 2607]KAJ2391548.1 hypothetical protein GGI05_002913 [Coemansia sp. RSA 2603]
MNSQAQQSDPSMLGRIADSASRLAGGIIRSATHGPSSLDPSAIAERKTGGQAGTSAMAREWMAEHTYGKPDGHADRDDMPAAVSGSSSAASAFRQTARALAPMPAASSVVPTENQLQSHQVQLAQNLDGRGVVDFLAQTMPTSMSTVIPGQGASMPSSHQARTTGPHSAGTIETTDPIAYLQGTTYATDMELADHLVPHSMPPLSTSNSTAANAGSLHSSPSGMIKSWNEHGASILEEWELNEAWDRAWMDTAWHTAKEKAKTAQDPKSEPVVPANRNLSNLLKPRI